MACSLGGLGFRGFGGSRGLGFRGFGGSRGLDLRFVC